MVTLSLPFYVKLQVYMLQGSCLCHRWHWPGPPVKSVCKPATWFWLLHASLLNCRVDIVVEVPVMLANGKIKGVDYLRNMSNFCLRFLSKETQRNRIFFVLFFSPPSPPFPSFLFPFWLSLHFLCGRNSFLVRAKDQKSHSSVFPFSPIPQKRLLLKLSKLTLTCSTKWGCYFQQ